MQPLFVQSELGDVTHNAIVRWHNSTGFEVRDSIVFIDEGGNITMPGGSKINGKSPVQLVSRTDDPAHFFNNVKIDGKFIWTDTTSLQFEDNNNGRTSFEILTGGADANRWVTVKNGVGVSSTHPIVAAADLGGGGNVNLRLSGQGTGIVQGYDSTLAVWDTVTLSGARQTITNKSSIEMWNDDKLRFGDSWDYDMYLESNDASNLFLAITSASSASRYFCIFDETDAGANREPGATTVDPTLRIYSGDGTSSTDFIDLYHDQTNANIAVGSGNLVLTAGGAVTIPSDNLLIGASPVNLDELDVDGSVYLTHTAAENDDHAMEIDCDAAAFGDVKALNIDYITGAITTGEDEAVILVNVDETAATGGTIAGLEMLATAGSADIATGLFVGVGIGPIEQLSGSFGDADDILNKAVDVTAALANGGAGNISVFVADNDTITIGDAAEFYELEFLFDTVSSGAGVAPTWEFSTGGTGFTAFSPVDGTNGFRNNGVVAWLNGDIPTWAANATGYFEIRVTRTRNSVTTTPILDEVQISAATEYKWDANGDLAINTVNSGTWEGTDVGVAHGGTGASTAQAAIDTLTAVAGATNEHVLTKDTGTGNAIFKAAAGGSSLPVADTTDIVKGSADGTKTLGFELDGATASKVMTIDSSHTDNRTLSLPDATDTLVGRATTDTLTNKTLTTPTIGDLTNATHNHSNAAGGGNLATKLRTVTKTLYIEDPSAVDVYPIAYVADTSTIVRVVHYTETDSVDFNIEKRAETTPATAGTNIWTVDKTANTTGTAETSFDSAAITAGNWLTYAASAITATPDAIYIAVEYTID